MADQPTDFMVQSPERRGTEVVSRSQSPQEPRDRLPQPLPVPQWDSNPQDIDYPGILRLAVDATDTQRGIINASMIIPVAAPGPMTLLYPKWMPGYHSPQNPLELFAGLEIWARGERLDWQRDPVEVYAFHLDVPRGVEDLEVRFQFLSPTASKQGSVVVTEDLMNLQWGRMVLYPAGYFSRRIMVKPRLTLPDGWAFRRCWRMSSATDRT